MKWSLWGGAPENISLTSKNFTRQWLPLSFSEFDVYLNSSSHTGATTAASLWEKATHRGGRIKRREKNQVLHDASEMLNEHPLPMEGSGHPDAADAAMSHRFPLQDSGTLSSAMGSILAPEITFFGSHPIPDMPPPLGGLYLVMIHMGVQRPGHLASVEGSSKGHPSSRVSCRWAVLWSHCHLTSPWEGWFASTSPLLAGYRPSESQSSGCRVGGGWHHRWTPTCHPPSTMWLSKVLFILSDVSSESVRVSRVKAAPNARFPSLDFCLFLNNSATILHFLSSSLMLASRLKHFYQLV